MNFPRKTSFHSSWGLLFVWKKERLHSSHDHGPPLLAGPASQCCSPATRRFACVRFEREKTEKNEQTQLCHQETVRSWACMGIRTGAVAKEMWHFEMKMVVPLPSNDVLSHAWVFAPHANGVFTFSAATRNIQYKTSCVAPLYIKSFLLLLYWYTNILYKVPNNLSMLHVGHVDILQKGKRKRDTSIWVLRTVFQAGREVDGNIWKLCHIKSMDFSNFIFTKTVYHFKIFFFFFIFPTNKPSGVRSGRFCLGLVGSCRWADLFDWGADL